MTITKIRTGFTLIELLLVIGIIAILSSIILLAIGPRKALVSAYDVRRTLVARNISSAINQYKIDHTNGLRHETLIPIGAENAVPICRYQVYDLDYCYSLDEIIDYYDYNSQSDDTAVSPFITGYMIYKENDIIKVDSMYIGELGTNDFTITGITEDAVLTTAIGDGHLFVINDTLYVAKYINATQFKISEWDGATFSDLQTITTPTSTPWEFSTFKTYNNKYYLVVNNKFTSVVVYEWNGALFTQLQILPSKHSSTTSHFVVDNTDYIITGQRYGGESYFYRYNGSLFESITPHIPHMALDSDTMTINNETFIVLGAEHSDSAVYKFNGTNLSLQQTFNGGRQMYDANIITIDNNVYLLAANYYGPSPSFFPNTESFIYKWNGTSFNVLHTIPTNGGMYFTYVPVKNKHFLLIQNLAGTPQLQIYELNNDSLTSVSTINMTFPAWNPINDMEVIYLNGSMYLIGTKVYKVEINLE